MIQAPVAAHVIDKGLATAGLLAQVLVAKHADHLPLYRQEGIFARAGLALARSTLSEWVGVCGVRLQPLVDALRGEILQQGVLHADETPVQMLTPGKKKTYRAYLWAYAPTRFSDLRAVVYDFAESRAGTHARDFLQDWKGKLVCDDYAGYKAGFALGITEIGCMAHARRKFFDLHAANKSQVAEQALKFFTALHDIERAVIDIDHAQRLKVRVEQEKPIADALHTWMLKRRQLVPEGSGIAKALDYSLKRWIALVRYLEDGNVPIDNNWIENQIRPWDDWALELAICRLAQSRLARSSHYEFDPVRQTEWSRYLRLSQGCADMFAVPPEPGHRRAVTSSVATAALKKGEDRRINLGSPDAYNRNPVGPGVGTFS